MIIELEALGFTGFYSGIWDQGENEYVKRDEMQYAGYEDFECLQRIDDWEFCEDYRSEVARIYSEYYIDALNSTLGIDLELVDSRVVSPKEYNFTTDRIFLRATINNYEETIQQLIDLVKSTQSIYDTVALIIKQNHTSCSGFWSFMSNDIKEWFYIMLHADDSEDRENYASYFIAYVAEAMDKGVLTSLNDVVYSYVECNTGLHNLVPLTDEAKEEWDIYLQYRSIYIEWANKHPQRYANPNSTTWPSIVTIDWEDYKEQWQDYLAGYELEQARREFINNYPTIPGLV